MLELDGARALIESGWVLRFDRSPEGLEVWVDHPTDPGVFHHCDPQAFGQLAVADRERKRRLRKEHTIHTPVLNSTAIYSYGYDRASETFEVRWTDNKRPRTKGRLWRWTGVPIETITEFELCKSKGAFLNDPDRFRGRYEGGMVPEAEALESEGWRNDWQATIALQGVRA